MISIFFLIIGFLLQRLQVVREREGHLVINQLLLYVCLPAATLLYTSQTVFQKSFLFPILMPWLVFVGSWGFFGLLNKYVGLHPHTKVVLILTGGIPSISFVGFPFFEMIYGEVAMPAAVMMSQAGSFLVCSTLGVLLATLYSPKLSNESLLHTSKLRILKNILRFPPFLSFCFALAINLLNIELPLPVTDLWRKLAEPFGFLSLISVGMQIDFQRKNLQWSYLKWGLSYKLILAPMLILIVMYAINQRDMIGQMCVLGSGLGPMNTVSIIAASYGLNPKLAAQMVGIGIPMSLLTTAFWYGLLLLIGYI
ncbi:MAG: AEC family transporter [Runella sp.]